MQHRQHLRRQVDDILALFHGDLFADGLAADRQSGNERRDHGGYELKQKVIGYLEANGYTCHDFGCYSLESCDYPEFGRAAAEAVAKGECEKGIVICTTGIGISIVANKVPGIRCGLCADTYSAKMTREHNDANMLAMGAGIVGPNLALSIVETFLNTPFSGDEKHVRRINKIEEEVK